MARPRLTVLDDGLFVETYAGEVRPLAATFNQFVEAVARTNAFESVRYVVPVRHVRIYEVEPSLQPVDQSAVELVPTTFFSGIGDYLLRSGLIAERNWPIISQAVSGADLLWLRLPASNALLALAAARRHGVPHFGWVAGSAGQVATAQPRPWPLSMGARAIGAAYDAVTDLAAETGPTLTLDADFFASVITQGDIDVTRSAFAPVSQDGATGPRIAWVGRMAGEKGLDALLGAFAHVRQSGMDATLVLVGDGPARPWLTQRLAEFPQDRVEDYGYVGDREFYARLLRGCDVLVQPSRAEGVSKVLVEAMAYGLPIVATDAGATSEVLGRGERGVLVPVGDTRALGEALVSLLADSTRMTELRERGLAWAETHTAQAQAGRLVGWLQTTFPTLPWS